MVQPFHLSSLLSPFSKEAVATFCTATLCDHIGEFTLISDQTGNKISLCGKIGFCGSTKSVLYINVSKNQNYQTEIHWVHSSIFQQ